MGEKSQRGLIVPKHKIKDYIVIELDNKITNKEIHLINIINDYQY